MRALEAARPACLFFSLSLFSFLLLQEFPGDIVNPYDDRHVTPGDRAIHAAVDGWLHCFREPAKVLPPGVPRILVRERGWIFFLDEGKFEICDVCRKNEINKNKQKQTKINKQK